MPEYDSNDKLTLTLDTLRSDVERTPLADSTTVRRRGDQRTRRQAVGGAVAVVALVAGIAGVLGGAGGLDRADGQIPATQNPTASTEVEKPLTLAAEPLLAPSDIGTIDPYTGWQVNTDSAAVEQQQNQCVPSPTTLGGTETVAELLYSDLDAAATEHVVRFATSAQALTAQNDLSESLASCDLGAATDDPAYEQGPSVVVTGADAALRASRTSYPPDSEVSYFELGVARKANVLVVLQWRSMGKPDGVGWVWDAQRLGTALDRAVG